MSISKSLSTAAVGKSASFVKGGYGDPYGGGGFGMSIADLGSLTRLEVILNCFVKFFCH